MLIDRNDTFCLSWHFEGSKPKWEGAGKGEKLVFIYLFTAYR